MSALTDSNMQSLISHVINENHFSHCRLCLKYIESQFVRFDDSVTLNTNVGDYIPLSTIMTQLFEEDVTCAIPGIDAVCTDCVDKTLEIARFLEKCKDANKKLNAVLDKMSEALNNAEIDSSCQDQTLYIVVEEAETKMIIMKNDSKQKEGAKSKKARRFECFQCTEDFLDLDELKGHNFSHHGTLTCEVCYDTYNTDVELMYHVNNAHKYECDHCHVRKDTEDQLVKHIDNNHTLFVCKVCGTSWEGADKFRSHEQKHNSKYKCPKCGKTYSTKEFYRKHVELCIEDRIDPHPIRTEIVKNFFCNICGKGYSSYGGLRVHNRFKHGDAKPHVCKQCGKEFTAPSYLKTHMIKHTGEKNFKCLICGTKLVSKEALLYHTRRHTGEKPYSCKHCNERFVNASARAEHIKFKHVGPMLMCEICSMKFVTSNFLKQHLNRHHDQTNKLYVSRTLPPNMPGEENYKIKVPTIPFKSESEK